MVDTTFYRGFAHQSIHAPQRFVPLVYMNGRNCIPVVLPIVLPISKFIVFNAFEIEVQEYKELSRVLCQTMTSSLCNLIDTHHTTAC